MKDDWPIAREIAEPAPTPGLRFWLAVTLIFSLTAVFIAFLGMGPNVGVVKINSEHIAGE